MICFKNSTQSLSCRTHSQGSAQSSKRTTRVCGTVRVVSSGFTRGEKAGEGSDSKYIDRRARISRSGQHRFSACTSEYSLAFMIRVKNVLVGVA